VFRCKEKVTVDWTSISNMGEFCSRLLARRTKQEEVAFKMELIKICYEGGKWMELVQDRLQLQAMVWDLLPQSQYVYSILPY
jgi:hypothetical protein